MAVYYPYIHIRDQRWLKVAALYWPRMVGIVGPDYPTRNSQLLDILRDELGFILDEPPEAAALHAAEPFATFIDGFGPAALRRMRVGEESRSLDPELLAVPHPRCLRLAATVLSGPLMQLGAAAHEAAAVPAA
jgi:hypothetical protein